MSAIKEEKTKKRLKLIVIFFKFLILLIFLIGIPFYVFYFHRELIQTFDSLDSISVFLLEYKSASIFAYIGFQIIQIIIFIIPGQAIQFAGGYLFSFWLGFFITFIGVALGTVITFYLARVLGKDAIHLMIGEERTHHYIEKFNSKKVFMVIFVIFLIPGIPKDAVTYIAGVSDMEARPFIIISLLGRLPAMIGSVMIGSMLKSGSYIGVVIISVVAIICFVLGIVFKNKLIGKSDKFYHKVTKL
ncbi:MAG: VTT domain-containing protein [Peptostreptococcaceae bacterium]|nr:VTT domain-containing protein [Peptostreptococcaceae bacterium]